MIHADGYGHKWTLVSIVLRFLGVLAAPENVDCAITSASVEQGTTKRQPTQFAKAPAHSRT